MLRNIAALCMSVVLACVCVKTRSLRSYLLCICSLCHHCVCVCVVVVGGQGTRQGVVSRPAAPVTWNKSSVVKRSCDSHCVCVCVFHPRHVMCAQGWVWEVLSRSERFLPPRQAGRQRACRPGEERSCAGGRARGLMDGWMDHGFQNRSGMGEGQRESCIPVAFSWHSKMASHRSLMLLVDCFKRQDALLLFESTSCGKASLDLFCLVLPCSLWSKGMKVSL